MLGKFSELKFKEVHSRISIDSATFTFGVPEDATESFGYRIFCAGSDSYSIEKYNPCSTEQLINIIDQLEKLSPEKSKATIKFQIHRFMSVRLSFKKYDEVKGFKVKAYILGFLYFGNSGFFSDYCSAQKIQNLIANLKKCIEVQHNNKA
ncbi:hypothetical protein [Bacterioplanoides sp.]|uniref:hypothetical protein n=1 Tax=Bacterioplanoides sp. TaxID=2066072 RepID=UPI003B00D2BC